MRERPERVFAPGVTSERQSLINLLGNKWLSGTTLRYYFFDQDSDGQNVQFTDGTTEWHTWVGKEAQRKVVRDGFKAWEAVGIGVNFQEVSSDRGESEIRIGFMQGDGAWSDAAEEQLMPSQSVLLKISAGEQRNLTVLPQETRYYNFQTFGTSDSVMVLFAEEKGKLRYRIGDDDSGQDTNAYFRIKLIKGCKYVLQIRMYFNDRPQETAVMMW